MSTDVLYNLAILFMVGILALMGMTIAPKYRGILIVVIWIVVLLSLVIILPLAMPR